MKAFRKPSRSFQRFVASFFHLQDLRRLFRRSHCHRIIIVVGVFDALVVISVSPADGVAGWSAGRRDSHVMKARRARCAPESMPGETNQ